MVQRITYRRRKSFNTRSNKIRKVKTPGGKLAVQYLQKKPRGVMCGDCKTRLQGVRLRRAAAGRARRRAPRPFEWGGSSRGCARRRRRLLVAGRDADPRRARRLVRLPTPRAPATAQIPSLRPKEYALLARREKTVTRAYGGSRCAKCVRQR